MAVRIKKHFLLITVVVIAVGGFFLFWREETRFGIELALPSETAVSQEASPLIPVLTPGETPISLALPSPEAAALIPPPTVKILSAAAVTNIAPVFDFSAYIPSAWNVESVRKIESLNIYDPTTTGVSTIDNSQIFVRTFTANSFVTLSPVKVLSRTETTVAGRPAVEYIIEKRPGYPNFPNQPAWRNKRHRVVDVRVSDVSPSPFYVFAKNPVLSDQVFDAILATMVIAPQDLVFFPIDGFSENITKKPFGIFISPENSPVSPEKFTGFHTAADAEIPDTQSATAQIPVYAMADGEIVRSGKAQGYGGVIAIRHNREGASLLSVYGHLNPKTSLKLGAQVKAGQRIGYLGKAYSAETDGERRHLHFGIYTGNDINIAGYVPQEAELSKWLDPVKFLSEKIQ